MYQCDCASSYIVAAIVSLFCAGVYEFFQIKKINTKYDAGSVKLIDISNIIKDGAIAYLLRQLKVLSLVMLVFFCLLVYFCGVYLAIAFLIGVALSWLCGFAAMYSSTTSNYKVAQLAAVGIDDAFNAAFSVGKFVGYFVKTVAFATVYLAFIIGMHFSQEILVQIFVGLSFGAALTAIFARIGGGIFTKGADIGADLVGKIEKNIPEDDARNPAVIADNVGDNVGDSAGMASDLFESYIVIVSSAVCLSSYLFQWQFLTYSYLIFTVLGIGSFASLSVLFLGWNYKGAMNFATLNIAGTLFVVASIFAYFVTNWYFADLENIYSLYLCMVIGYSLAAISMPLTEYYTSSSFMFVKSIEAVAEKGPASVIIQGLSVGMFCVFVPFVLIAMSILACMHLYGIFGLAIACVALISFSAVILSLDAFGPITDNAGGICEMAGMDGDSRDVTDKLDALGNITKATTKGYAVYAAILASLVLFTMIKMSLTYSFPFSLWLLEISSGFVMSGLIIGAASISMFAAMCLLAVNKASISIIEEVRAQFKAFPGIMNGTEKPDYKKAIDILTKTSLKQMILPGIFPIAVAGFMFLANKSIFGMESAFMSLCGFIIGAMIVGSFLGISMTISGAAWDNAKKLVEAQKRKGTPEHQATIIGDTIGDPYKDTVGPSMNPMMNLIGIVCMIFIIICSR